VLFNKGECEEYLRRFTACDDIVVTRVWVSCCKPKPRATSNVQLARYMKVDSFDWAVALETNGKSHL